MQINNHRSSHRKESTNSVITMKIMPVSYITNRRRIRFWMPLPTRQRALYVLGVIGCFHLLIQTIARVYLYFNPFSPYVAAVNVLSTYCYISNNEQRKYDEESYQKVIKSAQYEFESYATLYSSNVCYSANQDPSRSIFSFERALMAPLIKATLEYHGLSPLTTEVTDVVAEPFDGFGNLYHLLVQRSNGLLKLSTFLPAASPEYLPSTYSSRLEHVNLIVAYSNEPKRLEVFLNFLRSLMNIDQNFSVVLVNFVSKMADRMTVENKIFTLIGEVLPNQELRNRVQIISLVGPFSRGRGLNTGARKAKCPTSEHSETGCTLFFSDIDVTFTTETLNRCRLLSEKGKSAYFPMVFSQYNPDLSKIHLTKFELYLSKDSGLWRNFGFGMSCIESSDFKERVSFPEYNQWGYEDEQFHSKVRSAGLTVYRVPDPGLIHAYHSKNCSSAASKFACYKSQALTEGSSQQLGLELFKLKERCPAT